MNVAHFWSTTSIFPVLTKWTDRPGYGTARTHLKTHLEEIQQWNDTIHMVNCEFELKSLELARKCRFS